MDFKGLLTLRISKAQTPGQSQMGRVVLPPTGLWVLRSVCSAWLSGVWVLYLEAGSDWQRGWSQTAEGPGRGKPIEARFGIEQRSSP